MTAITSDRFVSAAAAGADWREAAGRVLDMAGPALNGKNCDIGFLYFTDMAAEDAAALVALFRRETGIERWTGSVGLGVFGCGAEFVDCPAVAMMAGRFGEDEVMPLPSHENLSPACRKWVGARAPVLGLFHGDPLMDDDPEDALDALGQSTGSFLAGGMSSSRGLSVQLAGTPVQGGFSGFLFARGVPVSTAMSQGCSPLGAPHAITRCEGHVVIELDGRRALDVFAADVHPPAAGETVAATDAGAGFEPLFKGEVHVAFPVRGAESGDYMVRDAIGIDPDSGSIAVSHDVAQADSMMFVQRDDGAMRDDLLRTLDGLKRRVERERGVFAPQGALYISCVARAMARFGEDDGPGGEMRLVRDALGDVPLAGFYANGEIFNHRLYGYTAVIILFH